MAGKRSIADLARSIIAYHGSPHTFDKFDISKIGTGEGAQAYGHGLYFADQENVARGYRDRIAGANWIDKRGVPLSSNTIANDVMEQARKDGLGPVEANDAAGMWSIVARDGEGASNFPGYQSVKNVIDRHGLQLKPNGSMYQVRIHADPAHFLDWDKPLSAQSPVVQQAVRGIAETAPLKDRAVLRRNREAILRGDATVSGDILYNNIGGYSRPGETSAALREAGIPGIKYFDAGSRSTGEGSRNYVMFDDKPIEILKRYSHGGATPAINMLTAQLLRYGWAAPRLQFLKQVPPQGYAGGGRRNADLFRRAMSALTASRPSAYFEIAPGETWDKNLQMAWETLRDAEKRRITDRALSDTFVPWQEASGIRGDLSSGVGGYKGYTNPSKIFRPENPDHIAHALNDLGETYAQDAMMGVGMQPFAGSSPTGLVSIQFPKGVEQDRVHDIYQRLMRRGLVEGHSTDMDAGVMSMLAGKGGRDTKRIARGIDREVGGEYPVWAQRAHVSFPENRVNYGLYRDASSVRPETLWAGPGRAPEIGAPEEFKAASRDHVRSLIEEALGAPQGAQPLRREGGGRANAALNIARRLGRMFSEGSGYQSVPGKPSTVNLPGFGRVEARPIPEIEDAAAGYARSRGLPSHTVDRFEPINPEFSGKVAREFDRMAHRPSDPLVRRAYDALIDDTLAQYRAAKDTGIDFRFLKPGQADPYAASPALGYEDIINKGRLFVFPTDQGFGTLNKAAADNPLLRRVGRIGDKDDAVANDAFRIVHDLYGHYGPGNPFFRAPGEERAFQLHSRLYSPEAMPAATAETRGQNSWVNYGPAGEHNRRASPADTIYADQKIGRMPSWTAAPPPAEGADVEGYIRNLIRNGRARGGSLIQDRFPTHYLPGVGRQVMADGGAAPSMNDLMAKVNSVFSRSSSPATAADLTGVSPTYKTGPGAYTDAGGLKINPAFVTAMKDGYPVAPVAPPPSAPTPTASTPSKNGTNYLLSLLSGNGALSNPYSFLYPAEYKNGGRTGFGSGGWRQFADVVEQAIQRAKDVPVRHRLGVYHNVDDDKIPQLANRFNGIPAPSLAISKPGGNPADEFGNSTLIGRPHLAIPTEDNHVFGGDAYTPRFPHIFRSKPEAGANQDFMFKAPGDWTEVPVTVENVLNHMRARPLLGGEGPDAMGIGLLKTHLSPRPKSLEELQRNRYRIAEDEDVHGKDWAHYQNQLMMRGHILSPYAHERAKYPGEQLTKAMIDFHNEGPSGLYRTYREDFPAEQITGLKGMMRDIKALDPSYLEAKPMRNVGFDEFSAAILPNRGGSQAADALQSTGMPRENIHFYDDPNERFGIMRKLAPGHGFRSGGAAALRAIEIARRGFGGGGVEPGDRAHEFVQEHLYDDEPQARMSPLVEQYGDQMARHGLEANADRPMPTAHEFITHQLNKQEKQLPQFDREARDKMRDYATEGLHGLAYLTPAAPAVAAYDIAHGLSSGDPLEIGMSALGAPGRYGKGLALAAGIMSPQEAHAESPVTTAALQLVKKFGRSTVAHPYRKAFPGIYGNPREIAAEAESRVAPESPALKQLFGVTRQDLYEIGKGRVGNIEPDIAMKAGARGTPSSENLMTPRNERRLIDVLTEAGNMEGLRTGMDPWYVMDPLYARMEQLMGPELAKRKFNELNHATGTMSPGSPVTTELNRGLAAYHLHNMGRYKDFLDYGGNPGAATIIPRGRNMSFAEEFPDLLGHAYHSTSQAPILQKYLETGSHGMQSPKVPLYIQSSGVPQTGFQTKLPVPDAHFTRAVGMADTRRGANDFGVSMKMPEYQQTGPWFYNNIAKKMGLEGVPAQARLWGAMSKQTGVDTAIGSPKLEMLANEIMRIANKYGISPERARDMVLQGDLFKRGGSVVSRALSVISNQRDAA